MITRFGSGHVALLEAMDVIAQDVEVGIQDGCGGSRGECKLIGAYKTISPMFIELIVL